MISMLIEQTAVSDAIGIDKATSAFHLTGVDAPGCHADDLPMLQETRNVCLASVESGQLYSAYPDATDRSIVFSLLLKCNRTDAEANAFVHTACVRSKLAGVACQCGPSGLDCTDDEG